MPSPVPGAVDLPIDRAIVRRWQRARGLSVISWSLSLSLGAWSRAGGGASLRVVRQDRRSRETQDEEAPGGERAPLLSISLPPGRSQLILLAHSFRAKLPSFKQKRETERYESRNRLEWDEAARGPSAKEGTLRRLEPKRQTCALARRVDCSASAVKPRPPSPWDHPATPNAPCSRGPPSRRERTFSPRRPRPRGGMTPRTTTTTTRRRPTTPRIRPPILNFFVPRSRRRSCGISSSRGRGSTRRPSRRRTSPRPPRQRKSATRGPPPPRSPASSCQRARPKPASSSSSPGTTWT